MGRRQYPEWSYVTTDLCVRRKVGRHADFGRCLAKEGKLGRGRCGRLRHEARPVAGDEGLRTELPSARREINNISDDKRRTDGFKHVQKCSRCKVSVEVTLVGTNLGPSRPGTTLQL